MVLVNFSLAMGVQGGTVWIVRLQELLQGRAAATLVVLAGCGLSLMMRSAQTQKQSRAQVQRSSQTVQLRTSLLRRALLLLVFGYAFVAVWPADILHFYGVYLTVGVLCLGLSSAWLLGLAAVVSLLFFALCLFLNYEEGWNWESMEYSGLWTLRGGLRNLFFNGFHPVIPWVAFVLVGMALGRLDLASARVARVLAIGGLSLGLGAQWLSRGLTNLTTQGLSPESVEYQDLIASSERCPCHPFRCTCWRAAVGLLAPSA